MTPQYAQFLAGIAAGGGPERLADWQAWFASRPPQIQRAIEQFPPGFIWRHPGGEVWHLIGWNETSGEDVALIFSIVNPFEDYDGAKLDEHKRYACMSHFTPPVVES